MTSGVDDLDALVEGAKRFSISLDDRQLTQFGRYKKLLLEWNERMNLTAITNDKDIQIRHFLDSLTCSLVTGDLSGQSLVDATYRSLGYRSNQSGVWIR